MSERERAVFKVKIEAPIEVVWRELTTTNELLPFFFNSRMETTGLEVGGRIRMVTPARKYTGVIGEVLEYSPPHRFSHTFRFTQLDEPPCKVTYELEEVGGAVEFTLIADDIPAASKTGKYMKQGGDYIVQTLKAVAERKPLPLYSKFILLMCKLSVPFTPKKSLSENWPLGNEEVGRRPLAVGRNAREVKRS